MFWLRQYLRGVFEVAPPYRLYNYKIKEWSNPSISEEKTTQSLPETIPSGMVFRVVNGLF
ncbi:hypothetical protein DI53_2484 [Sphingobacterium deserti]|uniref:Uncharacterized protein n=1 Tax=Sphingobacterium deserti TaxID=1229276 RepID=A0A0B8T6M9_9SPHI|nr:hypothetical protein DI53_2484 [Sphingobacterium deserti]